MTHRCVFISASLAALAVSPAALAQDQNADWTGPYAGVSLGASWGTHDVHTTAAPGGGPVTLPLADAAVIDATPIGSPHSNNTGFTGTFETGYNWQSGHLLVGLEGDVGFLGTDLKKSRTFASVNVPVTFTVADKLTTDWMWTIRPRIGYADGPWMIYGTGGVAGAEGKLETAYSDTNNPPNVILASKHDMRVGWAAGGGGAWAFMPNWSAKIEYLYADFGTLHADGADPNGFAVIHSEGHLKSNIVRAGLDYKF